MKRAFTMIELVFAIVVIGILAAIAAPKIFATREDAIIARAKSDVASIRSSIINRYNTNMLQGNFRYPTSLEKRADSEPFDDILQNSAHGWTKGPTSGTTTTYTFTVNGNSVNFTYDSSNGSFDCGTHSSGLCKTLRN
ncbi:type II secretion system protein [Campylobacter rectus]|uniref:type II secretion system protein n=1 Tax=Campylobacter rectus TaxID=203 RepID=UPI0023F4A737|nr:type II secretion system protein [Campylobacter rectus]